METAVIRTLQEKRVQRSLEGGNAQFCSAWDVWMSSALGGARAHIPKETIKRYRSSLKTCSEALDGKGEISSNDVQKWLNDKAVEGRTVGYLNTVLRNLRAVLRVVAKQERPAGLYAHLWSELESVVEFDEPPLEPRCPPPDFLLRVLPTARNEGEEHFMVILGRLGLRIGEALGLTPESYSPRKECLLVTRQKNSLRRKNKLPHRYPLDADLRARVLWLMKPSNRAALASGHGNGKRNTHFLFPWSDHHMRKFLKHLRDSLGDDESEYFPRGCGWHMFRHHAATDLLRKDPNKTIHHVQRLLGDKSITAAQGYYDLLRGVMDADVGAPIEGFDMSRKYDT